MTAMPLTTAIAERRPEPPRLTEPITRTFCHMCHCTTGYVVGIVATQRTVCNECVRSGRYRREG